MLPPTVEAATYGGTLYAAPQTSDGGLLYYRKDVVPDAAHDLRRAPGGLPQGPGGRRYSPAQGRPDTELFAKYEGLTVQRRPRPSTAPAEIVKPTARRRTSTPRRLLQVCSFLVGRFQAGIHPEGGTRLP